MKYYIKDYGMSHYLKTKEEYFDELLNIHVELTNRRDIGILNKSCLEKMRRSEELMIIHNFMKEQEENNERTRGK